jgi:hypothetical protein
MIKSFVLFGLAFLSSSCEAGQLGEPTFLGGRNSLEKVPLTAFLNGAVADYQVGDIWGKTEMARLDQLPPYADKIAQVTARVGGGTGWFVGFFGGKGIMASNHHVCDGGRGCQKGSKVFFPLKNISLTVEDYYGSWTDTDIALFSVTVPSTQVEFFKDNARPFRFERDLTLDLPLMTFGFGVAGNSKRSLMGGFDEDCRVLSEETRFIADPDEFNPGPYKVYSFANGCDVSHGDSGSAMVDRTNGDVVGIIWTGRIPKNKNAQSSDYIRQAQDSKSEFVWKEMSYGAPATEIKKVFQKVLSTTKNQGLKVVLADMLD